MGCAQSSARRVKPEGIASNSATGDAALAGPGLDVRRNFHSEYVLCSELGQGSFAVVMAARDRTTGNVEAVKIVDTRRGTTACSKVDPKKRQKAIDEIDMWRSVGIHPNIVDLRRAFCDTSCFFMVMERCECTVGYMLESDPAFLNSGQGLPGILRQMLLAVIACHRVAVVHRDIKPDNYLVGLDSCTIKLCDFNLSIKLPLGQDVVGEYGTPPFMSPEMVKALPHGTGTDVWSYGCMAYLLFFKELPYIPQEVSSKAAKAAVHIGVPRPRYLQGAPKGQGPESVDFCKQLLERDPSQRCSARYALQHSYFQVASKEKKHPAMTDTQSTLGAFDADALGSEEDDWESDGISVLSIDD